MPATPFAPEGQTIGPSVSVPTAAVARSADATTPDPELDPHGFRFEYLGERLSAAGVPIIRPPGGHAVYIDARALLPHVPPLHYPGIALVNALYVETGIRGVEIGTVMFGRQADGRETPAAMDLVRLAVPRRVYTQSHIDYVAEAVIAVAGMREQLRGYSMVSAPAVLRHFTAAFEPLQGTLGR